MGTQIKVPTSLDEQLDLLSTRGMSVDEKLARQWLTNVSYYRLSGYWYPYRILPDSADPKNPQRLDQFVKGTTFTEVVGLYEFDRKLRTLIHDGVERIETALRTRIGEELVFHGALEYKNPDLFRPEFNHELWIKKVRGRIKRASKRDAAIKHYSHKYKDYPFWVLAETLDFSDISILYAGLPDTTQRRISERLGFNVIPHQLNTKQRRSYYKLDPLARWLEQLTVVRNVSAHHGRLFNRYLTPASTNAFRTIPLLSSLPNGQSDKLYGALLIIAFMLRDISPGSSWPIKISALINNDFKSLTLRHETEMGFPKDWKDHLLSMLYT